MKTFDELSSMTEEDIDKYLREEIEEVINSAPKNQVLKLRALQAKMDGIRNKVKNPQVRLDMIYSEMIKSLYELNNALKDLTGG